MIDLLHGRRGLVRLVSFALLWLALGLTTWRVSADPPRQTDAPWQKALDQAQRLTQQGEFEAALKTYRKAAKKSAAPRFEILLGQARASNKLRRFGPGATFARQALAVAADAGQQIAAHSQLGTALYAAGKGNTSQLTAAIDSFRAIDQLSEGRLTIAQFNLGLALLTLERDAEGIAALQAFIKATETGPSAGSQGLVKQAKSYIDNPRRARADIVPAFSIRSLDGQTLTDQDLLGKVVVLDFWGTWCAPCVAAIPHLRKLEKRHRRDPFVLLSISNDQRLATLERFLAKESMPWPQIHDANRRLMGQTFKVSRYPTYWVIDAHGTIVHRGSGWSTAVAQQLDRAVAKALRELKKSSAKDTAIP